MVSSNNSKISDARDDTIA